MLNTLQLKRQAEKFGADLVGIAPVSRLADRPAAENPAAIFPQAKSLIVIGRRIPRGSLRSLEQGVPESFRNFGFLSLEDNFLARTTYDLVVWIESFGYEAVPMFGYDPEETAKQPLAVPVSPDKPAPNVYVDWRRAARLAGLGETGRHGLFLTPEYGTRQRFAMLLSDFDFEADPITEPGFCRGCRKCLEACPYHALDDSGRNHDCCRQCRYGAIPTGSGRFHTVERIGAACALACLAELESRGVLRQKFQPCEAEA